MKAASVKARKCSVLPPIIPEAEKEFLESIQSYIHSEIEKVGCTEQGLAEEYYIIYRNVFEMIIEHANAYKNILTTIKQEYDAFIEAIKKGQQNAFYLHGKLKILACESTTLMYYKNRISQLKEKIKIIEKNSERITNLIKKVRALSREFTGTYASPFPTGISMKDSLDINALSVHLAHLQQRVRDLKEDMLTKYIPLENTVDIEEDLNRALLQRNAAEKENELLKFWYKDPPCNMKFVVVVYSISSVFEHDPSKSKEAEDLIEYIERFNELFSRSQFEAAAIYAANCPRGILHNEETMEKFRGVGPIKGKVLPLLMYCEALISTCIATKQPLSSHLVAEAIQCALNEKRLDLVMHWVTMHRLAFCEEAGDAIFNYAQMDKHNESQCYALAQIVYLECGAHKKAALCLCKQGQIYGAMDLLQQCKRFPREDYIFLLQHCPSVELMSCLTQEWNGHPPFLSLGETVLTLIDTEHKVICIRLLEDISKEGRDVLEQIIVKDKECNVDGWKEIAEICQSIRREKLSKFLITILAAQAGVVEIPDGAEDAKLMEHVFW
uniref:Clathrin heavy chain linker domain-containing protein 1 n=1 Tax=Podarcis muralis TaxID=64176 RepID=A0A670HVB5_PODMU